MSDTKRVDTFTVFTEGDDLYDDMIQGILAADHSIAMECYIFEPDAIGMRFIEALRQQAMAGVRVQLHLDAFGSSVLAQSTECVRMIDAGIKLKWFNPLRWFKPLHFNRRNHRKLLVIDDRSVWLGGFNIHKENSQKDFGPDRWRDTHVRIDGAIAGQARIYFDRLWQGRRDWSPAYDQQADSMLISNQNWLQRHHLRRMLALRFYQAKKQIWMCTPYFMPDRFLQRQMLKAARRGIDVRLLLPYKTDHPVTQLVARSAYASLMESGIRIYEYQPRFMHAKTIVIDNDWCTVGSTNLDDRSFFVNYEINLVSLRTALVNQLQQNIIADINKSRQINPVQWARQGWQRWLYLRLGSLLRRIL